MRSHQSLSARCVYLALLALASVDCSGGNIASTQVQLTDLGHVAGDASMMSSAPDMLPPVPIPDGGGCLTAEVCGNGLDDDCNGIIDDGCICTSGAMQKCYPGNPSQAGVGVCTFGMQACVSTGEFPAWGECKGAGAPQPVVCGGGKDYRCDNQIDEGCGCMVGATQPCYDGPAGTSGVGLCKSGTQTCVAMGSTSMWGTCMGEVVPAADTCDGVDRHCDGKPLAGCGCLVGATQNCWDGPAGKEDVGSCKHGTQSCMQMGANNSGWGACMGEVLPAAKDGCSPPSDDDCDGAVGNGCVPCFGATSAPWQFHDTGGPMCVGQTFQSHGEADEYQYASIPPANDPGWTATTSSTINYSRMSRLCGTACTCLNGVDFDYWQTSLLVPPNYAVTSLTFTISDVDDGVRITIFNSSNPNGVVDPGSYAYLGGSTTSDLAKYIVPGPNRIVLTHLDDCCSGSAIANASITLNGAGVGPCM